MFCMKLMYIFTICILIYIKNSLKTNLILSLYIHANHTVLKKATIDPDLNSMKSR